MKKQRKGRFVQELAILSSLRGFSFPQLDRDTRANFSLSRTQAPNGTTAANGREPRGTCACSKLRKLCCVHRLIIRFVKQASSSFCRLN